MILQHLKKSIQYYSTTFWALLVAISVVSLYNGISLEFTYLLGKMSDEEIILYKKNFLFTWVPVYCLLLITVFTPILRIKNKNGSLSLIASTGVLFLATFVLLVLVAFERTGVNGHSNTTAPYILAVSVFSTITVALGWIIHVQSVTFNHRKSHTLNVLLQTRVAPEYQKRHNKLRKHYSGNNDIPVSDVNAFFDGTLQESSKEKAVEAALYFLNFFDFLANGIESNDLDEDLLYESIRGYVSGLWTKTQNLRGHEKYKKQPKVWISLKRLNESWEERYQSDPQRKQS